LEKDKPIVFSGMQATGSPVLGNYLGAIRHWVEMQENYRCLYCIVDMHSITVRQNPEKLRENARRLLALYIALGLNPEKSVIYYQSHVPAHAELSWILSCFTYMGELNRMTQFKDKSQKHADNINAGLYTYPVLMAADILLYQAALVPVGEDQKQHLELCRDVAIRFNNIYGDVFTVPEPYISTQGARIMSLQTPETKMSKSEAENENNVIRLLDEPETIMSKFKRAVTDSGGEVRYAPEEKPGVSNLLTIYASVSNKTVADCEKEFTGMGYGQFKKAVGEATVELLKPVRSRYEELSADTGYLNGVIAAGAQKAREMAAATITAVKRAIGYPE
jgi:tryptophanyl-tRNA synthetase